MHRDNKFTRWLTGAHSTVIYMSKFYRQKLVTNAHLEMVIFHAEIWFHKPDMLCWTHAWLRGHLILTEESSGQYQCDDIVSAKQILPGIGLGRRYLITASGKYLSAPDRFPRADWRHKFLVTGLNTLNIAHHAPLSLAYKIPLQWIFGFYSPSKYCTHSK